MLIIRWRRFSSLIFLSRQSINIESTVINGCIDHRWSTMIIIFPPFFPPPPADDFMAEWQRQRLIFFDCGVTFDHHRSAMIKNYFRWSWINNDDDNLLMFIFGAWLLMPMIDRHCSTYHRTLGSMQFQLQLETFVDQKLYLYQLISRSVKYYQDWIFSVIIIINIHENDRFQWSLYLYILVFMNHIVALQSYSHINS